MDFIPGNLTLALNYLQGDIEKSEAIWTLFYGNVTIKMKGVLIAIDFGIL